MFAAQWKRKMNRSLRRMCQNNMSSAYAINLYCHSGARNRKKRKEVALALNSARLSSLSAFSVYFLGVFCLHDQLQTICLFSTGVALISAPFKATFLLVYYMSQLFIAGYLWLQETDCSHPWTCLTVQSLTAVFIHRKMWPHFSIFYQEWPKKLHRV